MMLKTNLKLLTNRVVVRPIPDEAEESTSEITPQRGIVLAGKILDNDMGTIPPAVAVGDEVIYGKYAGSDVKFNGCTLKFLWNTEILAVVSHDVADQQAEIVRLQDSEHAAWGIIANAYGGNWDLASKASGWKAAAERWRDDYHKHMPSCPDDGVEPCHAAARLDTTCG